MIQGKVFRLGKVLAKAPNSFLSAPINSYAASRTSGSRWISSIEDCTGCGLCVEACPVYSCREQNRLVIPEQDKEPLLVDLRRE